jgi:alkylated DNA repair dioxygenase AlkB
MTRMRLAKRQQPDLFAPSAPALPNGLSYQENVLSSAEEHALIQQFGTLPWREFEFHGFVGKRRVLSFGWRYDFNGGGLNRTDEIPNFLLPVRDRAAAFAGVSPTELEHVLLTEYPAGATIGWHKDRPAFGDVIGLSLKSSCVFRLRRRSGTKFERAAFVAAPRSAYLLRGEARAEWEHSIPPVDELRYSITFRSMARKPSA